MFIQNHLCILFLFMYSINSFNLQQQVNLQRKIIQCPLYAKGPRELYTDFTVEPCPKELYNELGVERWGVWSTRDSVKYKVGIKSPLKVYDSNELSYIISGKMNIIPDEGPNKGKPIPGMKTTILNISLSSCYFKYITPHPYHHSKQ